MSETLHGMTPEEASPKPARRRSAGEFARWYVSRFDDGEVMRWAFRGLLLGTISVLGMDFYEMNAAQPGTEPTLPSQIATPLLPPAFDPENPLPADPRTFLTGDQSALRQPMRFTLEGDGVLLAEGAIDQMAAERLSKELDARGEYVRTVSLNSPGGAVENAIAMAKIVRDRKLDTEVADGALCASSCPLFLAGGARRLAGAQAAIGVHQFFAVDSGTTPARLDSAEAMSDAQITTARISRHLAEMGVDPAIWLHAMDTPPQALYYFSPKEMAAYKLVTGKAAARTEASAPLPGIKPAS